MRNIKMFIRKAYWLALNNTITHKGLPVPAFDTTAPESTPFPFILITNQTQSDEKDNSEFNYQTTIVLDIVTGGTSTFGRLDADIIADSVLQMVCTYPENYLTMDVGKIVTAKLVDQTSIPVINKTNWIHREVLTIENWIDGKE